MKLNYLLEADLPPMYAHQRKAVETAELTDAALIVRGAGSGKTRIGIEIVKRNLKNNYVLYICPASLVSQTIADYKEAGIEAYRYDGADTFEKGKLTVVSYDMLKRRIELFSSIKWSLGISDEFHRTRTKGALVNEATWVVRKSCKKFYALTATPFNNYNAEFFELLSIVIGVDIAKRLQQSLRLKGKRSGIFFNLYNFMVKFLFGKKVDNKMKAKFILNRKTIEQILSAYIDYVEPEEYLKNIRRPEAVSKIEKVELTDKEITYYKKILSSRKIPNKEMFLRTFLLGEGSSKINRAVNQIREIIKDRSRKVIVFSNFVDKGLGTLSQELKKKNIKHEIYKGSTPREVRNEIKKNFTDGDLNVLLISPSGFEGLNLKGTTDCIVLDPHYNPAKTEQIISRGLRAGSSIKSVNIFHYCSVSRKLKKPTIDEKIMRVSGRKQEINTAMEDMLKQINDKK